MLEIDIDYTSLGQALGDLTTLKEELSGGNELKYSQTNLLEISKGGTCDELNKMYGELVNFQLELIKLTTLTEEVVRNIGTAFAESETESMHESIQ